MFTKQKASVERALNQLMDIYNDKKDFIGLGFRGLGYNHGLCQVMSRAGKSMSEFRAWIQVRACCLDVSAGVRLAVQGARSTA